MLGARINYQMSLTLALDANTVIFRMKIFVGINILFLVSPALGGKIYNAK